MKLHFLKKKILRSRTPSRWMLMLCFIGLGLTVACFGLGCLPGFSFDAAMILMSICFGLALAFLILWILSFFRVKEDRELTIPAENILKESKTTKAGLCDTKYIIYAIPEDHNHKIHVNTHYVINGNSVRLCTDYDRGLCDTSEDLNHLELEYIEAQAYGSWMDGAR